MKKKFLALLFLPSLGVASFSAMPSFAEAGELPTSMSIGESVLIPSKTLSYNGESKTADVIVTSPSGGTYSGSRLTAVENGVYQITYRAIFGTHEEKETHDIRVDYRACDLFEGNGYVSSNLGEFSLDSSFSGVKATFENNGVLTYKKPVDLNKLSDDTPLVSFIIDPSTVGTQDFSTFNIIVTDAYDKNNYVTINCVDSITNLNGEGMYVKAGAVGQTLYGYEEDTKRHDNPSFGASLRSGFRSISLSGEYHTADIYFDYDERALYGYPNYLGTPLMREIVDLDGKADHPTDPFKGFSSGIVYLSFEAKNFSSGKGDVVFTSVAGENLSLSSYVDDEAPTLNVDLAGNSSVPDAVLGKPYKIFEASSFDEFIGDVDVSSEVYYLASDGKRIDVDVKDGYFTPLHLGDYEIVYSVTDNFRNEEEVVINVSCVRKTPSIVGLLSTNKMDATVYSSVALPSLDDFSVSGGSGRLEKSRLLIDPDGNLSSLQEDSFVPTKVGTYTVRYQAFDYLGQAAISNIKVSVKNLDSPIFLNEIKLPVALSKGEKVALPIVKAMKPGESSPVESEVEIFVNGTKLEGNSFVADGDGVSIAYVASSLRKEFELPVVDLGEGANQEKYFYGDGDSTVSENDVSFTAKEDGEVTFLRALKPSAMSLNFTLPDMIDGEKAEIELTDGETTVTLALSKNNDNYVLITSESSTSISLNNDSTIYLSYDNDTHKVSDGTGYTVAALGEDDNGNVFKGFSNDITLSFHLAKDRSISIKKINNQTFGKRGRETPSDRIGPELSFQNMPAVKQKVGSKVILPSAKAYDVLNEVESFTCTLTKPDGTKTAIDPNINNELSFEQYGSYRLEYLASDKKGNSSKTTRLFSVYESNEPSFSLTSSLKDSYKVGEEIALPSYKVSDDSSSYVVTFILLTPDYERVMLLKDENGTPTYYLDKDDYASYRVSSTSFKVKKEGKYSLLITAKDRFYNFTSQTIDFVVKGAK